MLIVSFLVFHAFQCELSATDLFSEELYPLTFFDVYLQYADGNNEQQLYAVPILITNYQDANGMFPNTNR